MNRGFWKLGNLLITIGALDIAAVFVFTILAWFFESTYFYDYDPYFEIVQLVHDLTLVLILFALMRKSQHIRTEINFPSYSKFNIYLLIFGAFTLFRLIFQWTFYFIVWDLNNFPYLYRSKLIITKIFEILTMIKLMKFGSMIDTPIGVKIKNGAILIIVGVSLTLIGYILDLLGFLTLIFFAADVILFTIGGIVRIVGYFKAGKNVKFIMGMHITVESMRVGEV